MYKTNNFRCEHIGDIFYIDSREVQQLFMYRRVSCCLVLSQGLGMSTDDSCRKERISNLQPIWSMSSIIIIYPIILSH